MSKPLTEAHHQWIREVSGGACDPAKSTSSAATVAGGEASEPLEVEQAKFRALASMWQQAEDRIRDDVDALYDELADHYDGDEHAPLMEQDFEAHVSRLFDMFDGGLVKDLTAVASAKSRTECESAVLDIRNSISKYIQFVQNDDVIKMIDQNPFIHLEAGSFCVSTLQTMLKRIE